MSLSENVGVHLPYLRRFARALTGSQESGDEYVAALLQSLIRDPTVLRNGSQTKVALYEGLCNLRPSSDVKNAEGVSAPAWEANIQHRLNSIPGIARQVFLLKYVEEFGFSDIALILNKPLAEIERLHAEANSEIEQMIASDVLIIEDEPLIAIDIEEIVTSLGHTSLGVARTRQEAVSMATHLKPQLILSDIQLADGSSGIDAVNDILKSFNVPVIFITAYPERLLTGSKPEPAFLITKPFSSNMVKAVIAQALFFQINAGSA
jgi:CheY-like chemotaxis protein/DNA-directed RNA polymerase specialized sigma24 family protein